jgi:hypothetical protein
MRSKVLMLHQLVIPLERGKPRRVRIVIDVYGMDRYQDGSLYGPFDIGSSQYPTHVDNANREFPSAQNLPHSTKSLPPPIPPRNVSPSPVP